MNFSLSVYLSLLITSLVFSYWVFFKLLRNEYFQLLWIVSYIFVCYYEYLYSREIKTRMCEFENLFIREEFG